MEAGFCRLFADKLKLTIERLGKVESLAQAYHNAITTVSDGNALIVLAHQDAEPCFPESQEIAGVSLPKGHWFRNTLEKMDLWFSRAMELFLLPNTGILGAAGAKGLLTGTAWWQYPDLSGSVIVSSDKGGLKVNLYGDYGRVAVLDGFLSMLKREAYNLMGTPPPELKGFHFYDLDLCMRSRIAGLKNYTIPILMTHRSSGASSDNTEWIEGRRAFDRIYAEYLPMYA